MTSRITHTTLRIPGTHGTWPKRVDWRVGRTGAYLVITRPLSQRTLIITWPWVRA